jgi:hypothetical protein
MDLISLESIIRRFKWIFKSGNIFLWVILFIPYFCLIPGYLWYDYTVNNIKDSAFIIISKNDMMLYLYNFKGDILQKSKIACGKSYGIKSIVGDNKTPEGIFRISSISESSKWTHDFKDGNGEVDGAYGPYFIRLNVPGQKGIGIHGTHLPSTIGKRASDGCVRMLNNDLIKLVKHIKISSIVIITPSQKDVDSSKVDRI